MENRIRRHIHVGAIVALMMLFSAAGARDQYSPAAPQITFNNIVHDFGSFAYGSIVYTKFPFRNTGTAPLVITGVERPCGCLLPLWPKNPIMPGDTGSIQVYYNSDQRPGVFRKSMVVYSNVKSKHDIIILVQGNADRKIKKKKQ